MSSVRDRINEGLTRDRLVLELRRARRPFAIWLAVIAAGIAATSVLLDRLDVPWPWQERYQVHVLVDDAKGVVAEADEIRIAGVPVGRVTAVGVRGDDPVLTVDLDGAAAPLFRDARLRLRPGTPLQDMYLDVVDRGTPAAGTVPDGGTLQAGRTSTPVDVGRVIDVFDADVRPRLRAAIDNLGRGLDDHGDELGRALAQLAPFLVEARRLTGVLAQRDTQTRRLVHNFALINEELARRDQQLTGVVRAGDAALGAVAVESSALGQLVRELPPTLDRIPRTFATVRRAADRLDPAFDALRPAAKALPGALTAARALAPDIDRGLRALDRALPSLTRLVRDAEPLGRDFQGAFTRLRPQAPKLDRITKAVVPCELAVQKFFHWTLSVTKFSDVHGVFPRGQDVAGTETAGGVVKDPSLSKHPSCAPRGQR